MATKKSEKENEFMNTKMKMRMLSLLLCFVMLICLMPATALAADTYTVTVTGGTASPAGPYTVDTEVIVTADPDPEGKKFKEWQIEGLSTTTSESRSIFFYIHGKTSRIRACRYLRRRRSDRHRDEKA